MDLDNMDPVTCLHIAKSAKRRVRVFFGLHEENYVGHFVSMRDNYYGCQWAIDGDTFCLGWDGTNFVDRHELKGDPFKSVFRQDGYVLVLVREVAGIKMGETIYGDVVGFIGKEEDEIK